jgi:hypothetical protein
MLLTRQSRRKTLEIWWPLIALGLLSIAMMLPVSAIAYRLLPELRFIQFPWRWLSPLEMVSALLVPLAIAQLRHRKVLWTALAFALVGIAGAMIRSASWDSKGVASLAAAMRSGEGYAGTGEYEAIGSYHVLLPKGAERISLLDARTGKDLPTDQLISNVEQWLPEQKMFSVYSPEPAVVALKLMTYPAWHVEMNGSNVNPEARRETGQMLLPVPAGRSHFRVVFVRTQDRKTGIALSFSAILVLATLGFIVGRTPGSRT